MRLSVHFGRWWLYIADHRLRKRQERDMNAQRKIDALKEFQKSIEGKAKFASEKSPYIDCDTETGEQTEIVAIPRTSTTAIKITLGK